MSRRTMSEQDKYSSDAERAKALASKLESLGKKLEKAKQNELEQSGDEEQSGWAIGVRYAGEFSAAIIVASMIGAGIDYLTGWKPWGLIVGMILGFMAGTRSIIRTARELSEENSFAENGKANEKQD